MTVQRRIIRSAALVVIAVYVLTWPAFGQDCPELVGRMPGPITAVAVSGDYAYLGTRTELLIAEVSDPSDIRVAGWVKLGGAARVSAVAVSDDSAYVVGDGGLRVIDVSTPSAPVEVGSIYMSSYTLDVAVSGGYAYVVGGDEALKIIDVSDPSSPIQVGSIGTLGAPTAVAVSNGTAYVTYGSPDYPTEGGLSVIDVSTPSAPVEVGSIDMSSYTLDVAAKGDYAYVVLHQETIWQLRSRFVVIDVSSPSTPEVVGSVETSSDLVNVAVAGDHAYVTSSDGNYGTEEGGLLVFDVSTPSTPEVVGSFDTPGDAIRVAVSSDSVYMTYGAWRLGSPPSQWTSSGFVVVDVNTPSAPVEVGFIDTPGNAAAVAVAGGYAYMALGSYSAAQAGLRVVDVSTPSAPVTIGSLDMSGASDVAVAGGYAYTVDMYSWVSSLRVIDVSTPSAPVEVGSLHIPWRARAVAVSPPFAYVAAGESGLRVIDVSTPSAPVEVGSISTTDYASGVALSGAYAFVTCATDGYPGSDGSLVVIDVSTPSAPVEVSSVGIPGEPSDIVVVGGYAYVTYADYYQGGGGLLLIDVSTPSAPAEVGFVEVIGGAAGVAVSRGYAYVGAALDGLRVFDVRTPSAPVEVGIYAASWFAWSGYEVVPLGFAVSDNSVFVAARDAGLHVFSECTRPAPDARECFIPAAAVAAGAEGAFFSTDLELNNNGPETAQLSFQWLPRGADNTDPVVSNLFTLAPGASLRFDNVLTELFGLEPDSVGALKLVASTESVIGMSRTYNSATGDAAGTFGQGLPAIRATEMIAGTDPQRIIFLSEDPDFRANVGCINGTGEDLTISIGIFDDEGSALETRTMELGPWSNDQLNRVLDDWAPVNGYVDVWADRDDALYYCYGSMLDNETSDPTTILPQVPSDDTTFIPAAALAAGLEDSFFTTDLDLSNAGSSNLTYEMLWLPRGADNTDPVRSSTFSLASGSGVRYADVLGEVFDLAPDQVGALAIEASDIDLLAMSRTYNTPDSGAAGTFGQGIPGIPANRMIPTGVTKRIIFMSDDDEFRANLGCSNGVGTEVVVTIDLHDSDGATLDTRYLRLPPYSNRQINGIFEDYAPVNGYVDVWTDTPGAAFTCYGSVLDNLTSDPTTVPPM